MTTDQLLDALASVLHIAPWAALVLSRIHPVRWLAAAFGLMDGLAERESDWRVSCDADLRAVLEARMS